MAKTKKSKGNYSVLKTISGDNLCYNIDIHTTVDGLTKTLNNNSDNLVFQINGIITNKELEKLPNAEVKVFFNKKTQTIFRITPTLMTSKEEYYDIIIENAEGQFNIYSCLTRGQIINKYFIQF